jgi:hypothetical protein
LTLLAVDVEGIGACGVEKSKTVAVNHLSRAQLQKAFLGGLKFQCKNSVIQNYLFVVAADQFGELYRIVKNINSLAKRFGKLLLKTKGNLEKFTKTNGGQIKISFLYVGGHFEFEQD